MGTCSNALALVCVALALTNLEAVGEVEEIRDELSANPSKPCPSLISTRRFPCLCRAPVAALSYAALSHTARRH